MSAPTPPPKRPDRLFDFIRLNVVFTWSSIGLLVLTALMVWGDFDRPWKKYQKEFRELDRGRVLAEMEAARQRLSTTDLAAAQQQLAEAQAALSDHRDEVEDLEKQLAELDSSVYEADARSRTTKSLLDTQKYLYEKAVGEGEGVEEARARADELSAQLYEERKVLQDATRQRQEIAAALDAQRANVVDANQRIEDLESELSGLQAQLAGLQNDIAFKILNAPLLEAAQPDLKIEQVILPGLFHDINFAKVDRVDRCMTCHVPANRDGYDGETWKNPYRSHPNLDLFVSDSSPHPYGEFGCTVCHGGLDRATEFSRAGHTPGDLEEQADWETRLTWEKQAFLETPILPSELAETGCLSCHRDQIWIPESKTLDVGRQLINKMGCYGCHEIEAPAFTNLRKTGPDLRRVAGKTTPEWAYRWIKAPREFHPTTFMPHFFGQKNVVGEPNLAKQAAEVSGLVEFIFAQSETPTYPDPPAGDAAAGKALFESVGCTGCHLLDGEAQRADFFPEINRLHGPNLVRTGSKVSAGWLYAWVKNPKQYFPDTNMPNLRLSDGEAADIVAYLMSSRDEAWEDLDLPSPDETAVRELVLDYLQRTDTIAQSEAQFDQMSPEKRLEFLGQKTVEKYGCFGCHVISGFEDTKPIGVELSEEGSKPVHLFDFGHVHDVPHTRHDWIRTKLLDPRIWDHGKELSKTYDELYRMPNFGMSEQEADAVLSNVLGFTKQSVRAYRRAGEGTDVAALAEGRKLITRFNCRGCHLVEGQGRAIRATIPEVGSLPPNLASEGSRVQSDWLFSFLRDPSQTTLRPWLHVRMPTFDFSGEQANALTAYFAALDGQPSFQAVPSHTDPKTLAVGKAAFTMLQCGRCHPAGPEALAAVGGGTADLAPSLLLAQDRLRHEWVPDWILNPQGFIPGTNMPAFFPENEDGTFTSSVALGLNAPMFLAQKNELMRYFDSEEQAIEYVSDAELVAAAIRDYVWTLGPGGSSAR